MPGSVGLAAACVEFAFGADSIDESDGASGLRRIARPLVFVAGKEVLLPLISRAAVGALRAVPTARDFAFLYGVLPSQSAVLAICHHAGIDKNAERLVATALLLCKPVAFIMMLVCAVRMSA